MKKYLKKIGPLWVACLIFQANNSAAQTDTFPVPAAMTNTEMRSHWLRTNFTSPGMRAQWVRSNANVRAEYHRLHPTQAELEWASNIVHNMKPPPPWPEPSKKREIFEHCAAILRSAIDTNEIETACSKLAKQSEVAELRDFSKVSISNLNKFASLLTSPDLNSYIGAGCSAEIDNSTNYFFLVFWSVNGPVRQAEKRTADHQRVLVRAEFYENGKLQWLVVNSWDKNNVVTNDETLALKENGQLDYHWAAPRETKP